MNHGLKFLIALLLIGVLLLPSALAQEPKPPVSKCLEMCTPQDVNEPGVRTGAESVVTILYAHCADIINRCVVNAQDVSIDEPNVQGGMATPTFVTATTGKCGDPDFCVINNWFYWASSAGLVESGAEGQRRTHTEPGLADTLRVGDKQPYLFFYLSVNHVPGKDDASFPGSAAPADALSNIGIYARVETGRLAFRGTVLMEGDTVTDDAGDFRGTGGRAQLVNTSSTESIYEFKVPLTVLEDEFPGIDEGAAGFTVSINVYQIKESSATDHGGWQITQPDWRVRYGRDTPARIVLEVENPMTTRAKSLTIFGNSLFARWSFISPLGSYDADDRSVKFEILGPTQPAKDLTRLVLLKRDYTHRGHFFPINVTWRFEHSKAGLADGQYTARMSALNYQGTYMLVEEQTFNVAGGQITNVPIIGSGKARAQGQNGPSGKDTPAPEGAALLIAMALAGVAFLGRRRG